MPLPVRFGRYELQGLLDEGRGWHVYEAVDRMTGRDVAVKILTTIDGNHDEERKRRFLQGARLAVSIQHDNVIPVCDGGEEQGYPFLAVELPRGADLPDAIRNGHTGDAANRTRIALEAARAWEFIHQRGIIHGEIGPESIFLEQSGRAKLLYFGIAQSKYADFRHAGCLDWQPAPSVIATEQLCLWFLLTPPEQVTGCAAVTPLTDVYRFGMVLYELFSGVKPVSGETLQRLFSVILHETPDREPLLAAGTPGPVVELIYRCIAKKPEERLQSFGAIVGGLRGVFPALGAGPNSAV
jgi:serine/threonine protein kinase